MKKFSFSALALATAFALSACSSHSDGNPESTSSVSPSTTAPVTQPATSVTSANPTASTTPATPATSTQNNANPVASTSNTNQPATVNNGKYTGFAYEFNNEKVANHKTLQLNTDNIDTLYVNNKRVEIAPDGVNPAYTFKDENGETRLSTGAFANGEVFLKNMRNGIYQNQSDGKTYAYVQGELAPKEAIPSSGKITYTGLGSYHITNDSINKPAVKELNPPKWTIVGTMMTADFDNKLVSGQLLEVELGDQNHVVANLEGKISGNQFSGEKDGTKMQGAFFGEHANEMGAIYVNEEKGFSGAFGARANWYGDKP